MLLRSSHPTASLHGSCAPLAHYHTRAPACSCTRSPQEWQEWGPSLQQLSSEEARALRKEHVLAQALQQQALQRRMQQQQAAAAKQQALAQQAAQLAAAQEQALAVQQQAQQQQGQQQGAGSAGAAAAARGQSPADQQQQQQRQQQQQAGGGRKRGREGEAAPARRTLRPRRATRLAAILKEEEEPSDSEGSNREGSRNTAGACNAVSTGSGGYQPDEASLQAEETEAEAARPAKGRGGAHAKKAAAATRQQQQQHKGQQQKGRQQGAPSPRPGLAAYQKAKAPPAAPAGLAGANAGSLGAPYASSRVLSPQMVAAVAAPLEAAAQGAGQAAGAPAPAQHPHVQMVGAAIVHYARELGIGEQKIQGFLAKPPTEQLSLYRTLHQARAYSMPAGRVGSWAGPGPACYLL